MLVVAAAMIAPVSLNACNFRHNAERNTDSAANDGRWVVLAQVRQPRIVCSRALSASDADAMSEGLPALSAKNVGRSILIALPSCKCGAGTLVARYKRFGPPTT